MPMNFCTKCLENNWSFQKKETWVIATCICGNEVMLESRGGLPDQERAQEGKPCRKCGGELVWTTKKLNSKRLRSRWHFCKWLACEKCRTAYFVEAYKVLRGKSCDCVRVVSSKPGQSVPPSKPVKSSGIFDIIAKI